MEVFEPFQQRTKSPGQGRTLDVLDVGTAVRAILRRFYLLVARKVYDREVSSAESVHVSYSLLHIGRRQRVVERHQLGKSTTF